MRNIDAINKGVTIIFKFRDQRFVSVIMDTLFQTITDVDDPWREVECVYLPLSPLDNLAEITFMDNGKVYYNITHLNDEVFPGSTWEFDKDGNVVVNLK
jgi:hypothetical protein